LTWPADRTRELVALRAAELSFGKIGKALGISRNAVKGKLARLGEARGPASAEISNLSRQDGWTSGLATFSHGPTFQFFISPSGAVRFYSWRYGQSWGGVKGVCEMHRRALFAALEAERIGRAA
jgi:hypothetical protein